MTISQETRDLARELYVIDGLTYEQVAERVSVNDASLKRWAKEEDWPGRREQYRRDQKGLKGNLADLRDKLLKKALENLDPQYAYAVVAIEKLLGSGAAKSGEGMDKGDPGKQKSKEELLKMIREEIYGLS